MSNPAPPPTVGEFDFRALSGRVPAGEFARIGRILRAGLPTGTVHRIARWGFIAFLGIAELLLLGIIGFAAVLAFTGPSPSSNPLPFLGILPFIAVVTGMIVVRVRGEITELGWRKRVRLFRFAEANGLDYVPIIANAPIIGSMFAFSQLLTMTDVFLVPGEREIEIGNYRTFERRVLGMFRGRSGGFLRIGLDRHVPHLVLLATRRRGGPASPLARRIRANQMISLEGDFDRHFTLYAPRGYDADVRYVLTPDLMALLIDEAGTYDVETIDDTLLVYSRRPFDFSRPETYQRILRLFATVGARTVARTGRYRDDRATPGSDPAASAGRRLVWAFPVVAVIAFALWVVLRIWNSVT